MRDKNALRLWLIFGFIFFAAGPIGLYVSVSPGPMPWIVPSLFLCGMGGAMLLYGFYSLLQNAKTDREPMSPGQERKE